MMHKNPMPAKHLSHVRKGPTQSSINLRRGLAQWIQFFNSGVRGLGEASAVTLKRSGGEGALPANEISQRVSFSTGAMSQLRTIPVGRWTFYVVFLFLLQRPPKGWIPCEMVKPRREIEQLG